MAQLGIRKFDDMIGRADLLDMRKGIEHWKASGLDFSRLFALPNVPADVSRFHVENQDHGLDKALDVRLIEKSRPAIDKGEKVQFIEVARNVNRSVGAMLSGALTKVHPQGLPDDSIRIQLEGTGGQSFGAFLARGITLYLIGDANDYTGKGLSGGRVVVRPASTSAARPCATPSSATPRCTARPPARLTCAAWPASASRSACRAPRRSSKARATTAANT